MKPDKKKSTHMNPIFYKLLVWAPTECLVLQFNSVTHLHGWFFFFFLIYVGCPGQLTRTTTIPHGPLDILQAQEQVRHRGGDRRTHRGSNPGRERNKSHELTTIIKPSSTEYTRELEPGHSGRAKPAKATELQAPCVLHGWFYMG